MLTPRFSNQISKILNVQCTSFVSRCAAPVYPITFQVFRIKISISNLSPSLIYLESMQRFIFSQKTLYFEKKHVKLCKKLFNFTPPFQSPHKKVRKLSHPITCERLQQLLCSWMCSHHGYSTNSKCNNLFTAPTCVIAFLINLEVNWFNCYILHGFINYFSSQMITDDYLSIFFSIQ